jgi:nucleotidyltransferase AbiEii toxin of type IV toxin-antitoxin system
VNLHREILTPEQETVLAATSTISHGWGAYLAGGVGLALQLGHRRSIDFDWFTPKTLPPSDLLKDVQSLGLPLQIRQNDEGTFLGQVNGVDFSVFRYRYSLVERPVAFEGCGVASLKDIAAMKMTAVVQRATKRDYVDLHALFKSGRVDLADAVSAMKKKFPGVDPSLALRALTYFKDVEQQPMPAMLTKTTWGDVQRDLVLIRDRGPVRGGPSR